MLEIVAVRLEYLVQEELDKSVNRSASEETCEVPTDEVMQGGCGMSE